MSVLAACLDICSAPLVSALPAPWPSPASAPPATTGPFEYTSANSATQPPADGRIAFNNANQTAATVMWVDNNTTPGADIANMLSFVKSGDQLYLQDKADSTKYEVYKLTAAPVFKSGYAEFPVAWQRGGGAISTNQRVMLSIVR